jgi:hypothetical protein
MMQGHGDVNVLKDVARGDGDYAVGRFNEVVAFAAAMLAAKVIDEAESRTELLGIDQEASAIRLPFF